jgi:hypothetical protein
MDAFQNLIAQNPSATLKALVNLITMASFVRAG